MIAKSTGQAGNEGKRSVTMKPAWKRIAILFGAAILAAGAAIVVLSSQKKPKGDAVAQKNPPQRISETRPSISTNKAVAASEAKKRYNELTREEKLAQIRAKYGDNIPENLKPVAYYLENPPQQIFHPAKSKFHYFKHRCEREIASVLNIEPGTWMMKKVLFGDKFDKDLAAALEDPIEFKADDTDEIRAMKEAVADTKKELAERMKNGETASEIMNTTISELYALGEYKRNLEEQVGEIRRDSAYSEQDVEDIVTAANEMLAAKGLPPMRMPNMIIRRASLKVAADRAAAKAKAQGKE